MKRGPQNLLEALAGVQHSTGASTLEPIGGGEAAPPTNPPQPTGAVGATNPGLALLQAYQAWRKRTGAREDPLQARLGQQGHLPGSWGVGQNDPVKLLTEGGEPFRTISHGANAGKTAQTYDLGDGRTANVYFDEHGRRKVNVFRA